MIITGNANKIDDITSCDTQLAIRIPSVDVFNTYRRNPVVSQLWDEGKIVEGLNAIKWSPDTIQDLENTVLSGLTGVGCASVS